MISTCFSAIRHRTTLGGGIITPALDAGLKKSKFSRATADDMTNAAEKGNKIMCVQDMGISSWEVFRIAIIGDLAMGIIAVSVCLGVGFGCDTSPGIWAITGVSLAAPTLGVDYICFRMSIKHITDEIEKNMNGEGTSNNLLDAKLN